MQNNLIDNSKKFIDCYDISENVAIYDFKSKTLKLGKTNLSNKQVDKISFLLAHDLKTFAELGGNFSNLSANAAYSHLQNNQ